MRGGCLLAVGARRARGSNKFSSVQHTQHTTHTAHTAADARRSTIRYSTFKTGRGGQAHPSTQRTLRTHRTRRTHHTPPSTTRIISRVGREGSAAQARRAPRLRLTHISPCVGVSRRRESRSARLASPTHPPLPLSAAACLGGGASKPTAKPTAHVGHGWVDVFPPKWVRFPSNTVLSCITMYHDVYQHVSATYRLIHRYTPNTSLIRADTS